jgi:hypothetical protein
MHGRSPRFRRAMEMVAAALEKSDLDLLRAYADMFNPGMWLNCTRGNCPPVRVKRA